MIPIRSTIKTAAVPYVNYALIAANLLAFAYALFLDGAALEAFHGEHGLVPRRVFPPDAYGTLERTSVFFASMFVHGGWLHIAGNMIFLHIFGRGVEDRLGHFGYLLFYLTCGLATAFLHTLLNIHSEIPTIGASGAISGVLGAYMLFFPRSNILTLLVILIVLQFVRIKAYLFVIVWLVFQFLGGIGYIGGTGGVAPWAHIGGMAGGLAFAGSYVRTEAYRRRKYRAERQNGGES